MKDALQTLKDKFRPAERHPRACPECWEQRQARWDVTPHERNPGYVICLFCGSVYEAHGVLPGRRVGRLKSWDRPGVDIIVTPEGEEVPVL